MIEFGISPFSVADFRGIGASAILYMDKTLRFSPILRTAAESQMTCSKYGPSAFGPSLKNPPLFGAM